MMITELNKIGVFELMEREALDYVKDEKQFLTASENGDIKGANYTMTGAITLYYYDEQGAQIAVPIIGGVSQKKQRMFCSKSE